MSAMRLQILLEAIDRASAPLRETTRRIDGMARAGRGVTQAMSRLGAGSGLARMASHLSVAARSATNLAGALTRVARNAALVGAGTAVAGGYAFNRLMVRPAADFQNMRMRMRVQEGGNEERTAGNLRWIEDYASRTRYSMTEVFENFVRMQNSGLDPRRYLPAIANAASGTGKSLEQAVEAFNDAVGGEFERLREFAIRGRTEGNRATLQWQEGDNQMRIRNLDAQNPRRLAEALRRIFDRRFPNMTEESSRTWDGMLSNMGDHWDAFRLRIMNSGVFDWMQDQLKQLLERIDELKANGTLDEWARSIGASILTAFRQVRDFITGYDVLQAEMGTGEVTVVGRVPGIFERLQTIFGQLREFWNEMDAKVTSVANAITAALDAIERRINTIRAFFSLPALIPQLIAGGGATAPARAPAGPGEAAAPGAAAPAPAPRASLFPDGPLAPGFSEGPLGRLLGRIGEAASSGTDPAATPRGRGVGQGLRRPEIYGAPMMQRIAPQGVTGGQREEVRVNAGLEVTVRADEGLRATIRQTQDDGMQVVPRRGILATP